VTSLLRPALILFVLLTLVTGIAYPLFVTGIAQLVFPAQANGSVLTWDGKPVGSSLIGQDFSGEPEYFWGRLSATTPVPYAAFNAEKAAGSSGSNLGPTNPALVDNAKSRIEALKAADVAVVYARPADQPVPVDLVTSSASGLDPHISTAAAEYQLPRVAKARGMTEEQVRTLLRAQTQGRQLGVLGEPVVNVLEMNLALDEVRR
jgi:K+-transporting ATPase ATPase C chain